MTSSWRGRARAAWRAAPATSSWRTGTCSTGCRSPTTTRTTCWTSPSVRAGPLAYTGPNGQFWFVQRYGLALKVVKSPSGLTHFVITAHTRMMNTMLNLPGLTVRPDGDLAAGVPGRAWHLSPHCLLVLYRCLRTHSPHNRGSAQLAPSCMTKCFEPLRDFEC
jgi:hypothetical protein